ncbi:hypothetical protein OGAPHI_007404 [Ogataea philodendri]|uniref:Uracil catabolism protein 4 n=1 Tax=Ogataea philodendri TaxID=1378263 RepID=A0A9P8SZK5_9ASCO|nr:uncharacterized protein OGAPHI_007404 [Ogataea philodendri]KAH3660199.1 hypothetical protein OGAPHI_007404 [Ogataea philodendri]
MAVSTEYLLSIESVRETNSSTKTLLFDNKLTNFDVDLSKLSETVDFVVSTIKSSFPTNESFLTIPVHGRYQHFECGNTPRLTKFIQTQLAGQDDYEICKKLIDLFIVSVLLDAGAGNQWSFDEDGTKIGRSEGIAVASFHMFLNGVFSDGDSYVVNGAKLAKLSAQELKDGLQVSETNPISGFEGRLKLLNKLGTTLVENSTIFGEDARPGNLVDFVKTKSTDNTIDLPVLWKCLMEGLNPIWPTEGRIKVDGKCIGDSWYLQSKIQEAHEKYGDKAPESAKVVTFHKLTQWLTYSLFLPLQKFGHFTIKNAHYMTGLPEYRNGGLFVDFGVLKVKESKLKQGIDFSIKQGLSSTIPLYTPDDDLIVEWRSSTIVLLDHILSLVNDKLDVTGTKYELSLPQLIEAGSWKSGRLVAAKLRSNGGPPIELFADGTVF